MAKEKFCDYASYTPDIDDAVVVLATEDQLWSSVISRADVRNVWFSLDKFLGRPEISKFQNMSCWVNKQILRLDISVANTQRMDISQGPEHLVGIHLYQKDGNALLHFDIVPHNSINGLWDVIHDYIEVYLIGLISTCVEGMLHLDNIGMEQFLHNLKFSVFISFILVDLLNGDDFTGLRNSCLVNDSKGSVSNNSFSIICYTCLKTKVR